MQLPLAHSGWLFQEEGAEPEDPQPRPHGPKEEKMDVDPPAVKGTRLGAALGGTPLPNPTQRPPTANPTPTQQDRKSVV